MRESFSFLSQQKRKSGDPLFLTLLPVRCHKQAVQYSDSFHWACLLHGHIHNPKGLKRSEQPDKMRLRPRREFHKKTFEAADRVSMRSASLNET